jgi:hypothetical protein
MNVKIMRNFLLSIHQLSQAIQSAWTALSNRLRLQRAIVGNRSTNLREKPSPTEESQKELEDILERYGIIFQNDCYSHLSSNPLRPQYSVSRFGAQYSGNDRHLHIAIDELQFTQNQVATEGQGIHTAIVRQGRLSEQQREVIRDGLIWLKSFSPNFSNTL